MGNGEIISNSKDTNGAISKCKRTSKNTSNSKKPLIKNLTNKSDLFLDKRKMFEVNVHKCKNFFFNLKPMW